MQVVVVNKLDSAPVAGVQQVMANIAQINLNATVIQARSNVGVDKPDLRLGEHHRSLNAIPLATMVATGRHDSFTSLRTARSLKLAFARPY